MYHTSFSLFVFSTIILKYILQKIIKMWLFVVIFFCGSVFFVEELFFLCVSPDFLCKRILFFPWKYFTLLGEFYRCALQHMREKCPYLEFFWSVRKMDTFYAVLLSRSVPKKRKRITACNFDFCKNFMIVITNDFFF